MILKFCFCWACYSTYEYFCICGVYFIYIFSFIFCLELYLWIVHGTGTCLKDHGLYGTYVLKWYLSLKVPYAPTISK
jgi:hypothetical protein